jgi:hypothetical protein
MLIPKQWRKPLKVVADVGKARVIGTVLKENPLTTVVKLDPVMMMTTQENVERTGDHQGWGHQETQP